MARTYWIKAGRRKVWTGKVQPARAFVTRVANQLRCAVTLGFDDLLEGSRKRLRSTTPRGKVDRSQIRLRRNPDPGAYLDVWREQERGRAARAERAKALKPARLAKTRRGLKAGPVIVYARRGAGQVHTLRPPTRREAEALADELELAGFTVQIRKA